MIRIDIGMFAHNEASGIATTLRDCLEQTIFRDPNVDARLVVLANGCSDNTAAAARLVFDQNPLLPLEVIELQEGGKSRTFNRLVHDFSRENLSYFILCDADIRLPDPDCWSKLLATIQKDELLAAVPSRPVKDIAFHKGRLSLVDKLIHAGADGLGDWKTAICGQLYIARANVLRSIWLPVGLPVEDGFIGAMIVTDNFKSTGNSARINGSDDCFHVYESERTIRSLVRHQTRIVIGSAINALIFTRLHEEPPEQRAILMQKAARDDNWLNELVRTRLPRWPYGWVPIAFLVKRIQVYHGGLAPDRLLKLLLGFSFDALVYLLAQLKMARGTGAGYW